MGASRGTFLDPFLVYVNVTVNELAALALFFFFNDTATTEIYTLSLHDALPISYLWDDGPGKLARPASQRSSRLSGRVILYDPHRRVFVGSHRPQAHVSYRLGRHRGVRVHLFCAAEHQHANLDLYRYRVVFCPAQPDVRSAGRVDRGMLHAPPALQRRLDRLPALLGHRRRPSAADRDRAARGIRVGVCDRRLHPFLCDRQRGRDGLAARLHQPRHFGGVRLAIAPYMPALIAPTMEKRQNIDEQIEAINLLELEMKARESLPQTVYDYCASGANDEITLRENRLAYERITLLPHMLVDVSERHMGTTALGEPVSMPILIAPTAFQGLAHPEGEVATVKAAGAAKTLMTLSTGSTFSIEEVMAVATGPVWFQLYLFKDRAISASLVKRAEVAGCKAIVFTVDVPLLGRRERDVRNRFKLPDDLSAKNLLPAGLQEFPDGTAGSGLASYIASLLDPALTWKDIEWLTGITKLPVLVKGILRSDDALLAVNHGASGVIVSNHGARQLDTTPATISILPEIVDAVGGKVEVYVDGGIRRGTDVLKAIACGARAVFLGRPVLWGLASGAEAGVRYVLEMLRQEFDLAMALSGCPTLSSITRDLIRRLLERKMSSRQRCYPMTC